MRPRPAILPGTRRPPSPPPSPRGRVSATHIVEATLARIRERDPLLNSFTAVTERARARPRTSDRRGAGEGRKASGRSPACRSRSRTCSTLPACRRWPARRSTAMLPPATRDAALIERLEAAGAILVGALNMGEYAYDFTGENIHDGPSRNPHDLDRMTGGSSGGSGAAVGGGLVPLALGSDTNGSIRVPSSLCGIFGLKPTYGRLSARADISVRGEPRPCRPVCAHDARSGAGLRRHAGPRPRRSGLRRSRGRAGRAALGRRHRRPAHRGRRRLFQRQDRRGASPPSTRVAAALGANRDIEIPASRARPLGGLRHHRERGREPASRPPAHARAATSIPPCATG